MNKSVALVSYSFEKGGAAIAARRQYQALARFGGGKVSLVSMREPTSTDALPFKFFSRTIFLVNNFISRALSFLATGNITEKKSINCFSVPFRVSKLDKLADIVHIHWIHNETLSLSEIERIKSPVVWTLHDAWLVSAPYHLGQTERLSLVQRYLRFRIRKLLARKHITFISPSRFGARLVEDAYGDLISCNVVANAIDTDIFSPNLGFPADKEPDTLRVAVVIGSGEADFNKGFDLLLAALEEIVDYKLEIHLIGSFTSSYHSINHTFINHGFLYKDFERANILKNMHVTAIPSRFEMFCQVACESLSCGTPIAAFSVGGLKEFSDWDTVAGMALPFDSTDFGRVLCSTAVSGRNHQVRRTCRAFAIERFSLAAVSAALMGVYATVGSR